MAHTNPPTVSVLMPIFNGEKYIELAIQSVLE
jgi:glycosyltransferase involved in cell wall biosynthesis